MKSTPPALTPRVRFSRCILALATALRAEIDDPTMEIYWRAVRHAPIQLLESAAEELAGTARFMPKPAEWLQAVDELLDRRARVQAIAGPKGQPLLPGEIGEYQCEDCGNSGWITIDRICDGGCKASEKLKPGHRHSSAQRCTNAYCKAAREQKAERRKRYARGRE
jgi:hypothetical protein